MKQKLPEIPNHSIRRGLYEHYKGGIYDVLGVGRHTETGEPLVVYIDAHIDTDNKMFMRPLAMFEEMVEVDDKLVPRFKRRNNA
jgi:hypothetical protein